MVALRSIFGCLSAGGAGTLPAEAVREAYNKQGATIAIFLMKFLSSREAENREGAPFLFCCTSPFFGRLSAQPTPKKCFKMNLQRLANLSKIGGNSAAIRPKCSPNPSWETLRPNSGALVLFQILQKTTFLT